MASMFWLLLRDASGALHLVLRNSAVMRRGLLPLICDLNFCTAFPLLLYTERVVYLANYFLTSYFVFASFIMLMLGSRCNMNFSLRIVLRSYSPHFSGSSISMEIRE